MFIFDVSSSALGYVPKPKDPLAKWPSLTKLSSAALIVLPSIPEDGPLPKTWALKHLRARFRPSRNLPTICEESSGTHELPATNLEREPTPLEAAKAELVCLKTELIATITGVRPLSPKIVEEIRAAIRGHESPRRRRRRSRVARRAEAAGEELDPFATQAGFPRCGYMTPIMEDEVVTTIADDEEDAGEAVAKAVEAAEAKSVADAAGRDGDDDTAVAASPAPDVISRSVSSTRNVPTIDHRYATQTGFPRSGYLSTIHEVSASLEACAALPPRAPLPLADRPQAVALGLRLPNIEGLYLTFRRGRDAHAAKRFVKEYLLTLDLESRAEVTRQLKCGIVSIPQTVKLDEADFAEDRDWQAEVVEWIGSYEYC